MIRGHGLAWVGLLVAFETAAAAQPPVAHFSFDHPGDPGFDDAGGFHATQVVGVTETPGVLGSAGQFTFGYMQLPDVPQLHLLQGDFTLSLFIKSSDSSNRNYFTSASNAGHRYGLGGPTGVYDASGRAAGYASFFFNGSSAAGGVQTDTPVFDGAWHHVAAIKRGATAEIWVDGVRQFHPNGTVNWNDVVTTNFPDDGAFAIGRDGSCCEYFNGAMDEVKIWNRALSADEILAESTGIDPCDCQWRELAAMPTPRVTGGAGMAVVDDRILVIGSHEGNPGSGRVNEEYDVALDQWSERSPYPRGDGRGGLNRNAAIDGQVYFFGGNNIFNNYVTSTVDAYDEPSDSWLLDVAQYATPIANVGSVVFGGQIYVFGGSGYGTHGYTQARRFDPISHTFVDLAPLPVGRITPHPFVMGADIWVAGGFDYNPVVPSTTQILTIDIYHPATDTWTPGPVMPAGDWNYDAGVFANGLVYALYGGASTRLYVLDPSHGGWHHPCLAPQSHRDNFGAVVYGNDLHVIGGGDPKLGLHQSATASCPTGNRPPVANAGPDQVVAVDATCRALVQLDGRASSDPDGEALRFNWSGAAVLSGAQPSVSLPVGLYDFTLTVADPQGATSSDAVTVTATDTTPPAGSIAATPTQIWPPNHKMASVALSYSVADNCGSTSCTLTGVTSNEAISPSDWQIVDANHVLLRADREGSGPGRVYRLQARCSDAGGNAIDLAALVTVPHDASSRH